MTAPDPYAMFLAAKAQHGERKGFAPVWMPSFPFDFQSYLIDWNLWAGKSATLIDCGMGKTIIELVWAENITRKTNKPVIILTPLSVAQQFMSEAIKFGIEAKRSDGTAYAGINITNYEKLHRFNPDDFSACVCDEASCIKAFDGARRAQVTEFLRRMPYRLMATATAAPNDYIELGTLSQALGVMGQVDMLNRFFVNDRNTSDMKRIIRHSPAQGGPQGAGWRFKGHAELPFWRWMCGFTRAGRKPSDLGAFPNDRFVLPPLIEREHTVTTNTLAPGMLIPLPASNMQEEREETRRTIKERCEMAAELVNYTGKPFIVWCGLNDEGDLLERLIPDAVQISGADADEAKEEKYGAFLSGQKRGMISKQKIGGWGLNCQHCPHVVEFATHSWESHYQGVRRCWRFGQTQPVINDIIATEGQRGTLDNMQRKAKSAERMFDMLVRHMHEALEIDNGYKFTREVMVPKWLQAS